VPWIRLRVFITVHLKCMRLGAAQQSGLVQCPWQQHNIVLPAAGSLQSQGERRVWTPRGSGILLPNFLLRVAEITYHQVSLLRQTQYFQPSTILVSACLHLTCPITTYAKRYSVSLALHCPDSAPHPPPHPSLGELSLDLSSAVM